MKRMFLAGPFKALVDPQTNSMAHEDIELFTPIIDYFERLGWEVHCAHKRERWRREFMTPAVCTLSDAECLLRRSPLRPACARLGSFADRRLWLRAYESTA
jgi:hypothetical protein